MAIVSLLEVFKEFREWLLGIDKATLERNKEEKNALKSLFTALADTKAYFDDRKTLPANKETERKIAKLWFDAATELKSIDQSLANRCFLKGDFWTDPDNWKQGDGEKINISIDEMTRLAKQYITA